VHDLQRGRPDLVGAVFLAGDGQRRLQRAQRGGRAHPLGQGRRCADDQRLDGGPDPEQPGA
jgi:hypothetical protein